MLNHHKLIISKENTRKLNSVFSLIDFIAKVPHFFLNVILISIFRRCVQSRMAHLSKWDLAQKCHLRFLVVFTSILRYIIAMVGKLGSGPNYGKIIIILKKVLICSWQSIANNVNSSDTSYFLLLYIFKCSKNYFYGKTTFW